MERMTICHDCGRTIDAAFRFCPWCGSASERAFDLPSRVDKAFERIETLQRDYSVSRIERLDLALGNLERELSLIVSHSPRE